MDVSFALSQCLIFDHIGLYGRIASTTCPLMFWYQPDQRHTGKPLLLGAWWARYIDLRSFCMSGKWTKHQCGAGASCSTPPGHCPTMQAVAKQAEVSGRLTSQAKCFYQYTSMGTQPKSVVTTPKYVISTDNCEHTFQSLSSTYYAGQMKNETYRRVLQTAPTGRHL